jgi:hypothetical protein
MGLLVDGDGDARTNAEWVNIAISVVWEVTRVVF